MTQNLALFSTGEDNAGAAQAGVMGVLVPYPLDKAYDYALPEGIEAAEGDYVCVPLGKREIPGVIWGKAAREVASAKIKNIVSRYDLPSMPEDHRKFLSWTAEYTMAPLGSVLKMSLSVPAALEAEKPGRGYRIAPDFAEVLNSLPSERGGLGWGGEFRAKPDSMLIHHARAMRKEPSEAEKKLWFHINREQLEGHKFRRQHPVGSYIADFICLEKKLIIEVDGGQHTDQKDYDDARTRFLEHEGFRVSRFWNNEVLENIEGVLQSIKAALASPPRPSPHGGEGERERFLKNLSPAHRSVLEVLRHGAVMRASEITQSAGCSPGVIKTLLGRGILEDVALHTAAPCRFPDPGRGRAELSADQASVAETLCAALSPPPNPPPTGGRIKEGGRFQAFLLDGVTGAGKTETYFEGVAAALKAGKQVLILLPEIALSNAFLERFKSRFGCLPALWHSDLTPAQRRITWRGVAMGETKVVIGARSALFLPFAELGLIVVDEEHDPAYKQEEGVIYNARDMAVVRAHLGGFPIVLVSATPSLETMQNAWTGRYHHLHLRDRFGGAHLPDIHIIDMREDKPEKNCFISPIMRDVTEKALEDGGQVLYFLNRRGYAPLTLCRTCGHRMACPRCTAWLVEHKAGSALQCHHCGFSQKPPKDCPSCNDIGSFAACGPGVERIYEEAGALFPDARLMMLASDTAEDGEQLKSMLEKIRNGEVDIIIGTQIIAKGHHFPNLTCVGVIDADLGLQGGDLRAAERTYQLLHQVAGRAGREQKRGSVYLQSFMPEHRIMQAMASDSGHRESRDEFLEVEAMEREEAHMPPFSRLAGIIVSGREEAQVIEVAKQLGKISPQGMTESGLSIQTLGPAPAPLSRLRGRYRYRLLVNADKRINLQKTIAEWLGRVAVPSTVRVQVDIDPQSFL